MLELFQPLYGVVKKGRLYTTKGDDPIRAGIKEAYPSKQVPEDASLINSDMKLYCG